MKGIYLSIVTVILALTLTSYFVVKNSEAVGMQVNTVVSSTITTNRVTVTTATGGVLVRTSNASRSSLIVRNVGSVDAYCGSQGVTSTTGFLIKAGEAISLDRTAGSLYCVTASGSTAFVFLED